MKNDALTPTLRARWTGGDQDRNKPTSSVQPQTSRAKRNIQQSYCAVNAEHLLRNRIRLVKRTKIDFSVQTISVSPLRL